MRNFFCAIWRKAQVVGFKNHSMLPPNALANYAGQEARCIIPGF